MSIALVVIGLLAAAIPVACPAAEPPVADDVLLENLIRIPSVSADVGKVNEVVRYLRRRLESDGLFCRMETMPDGREVLFAANTETTVPDVLFSAHLDVVPAQTPDLFVPRRADGKICGRGASDCKEHCVLAARLMRELKGQVSAGCLFGSDEEIGGDSTVFMLDRGYGAHKLVIVLDAEQYTLTTRQKGLAYYSLTRTAAAAHGGFVKGSMPHAVKDLMAGYAALTEVLPETEDGSWRDVVSLLSLNGDREKAELKVSVRCARKGDWPRLENLLREKFGVEPVCIRKGEPVFLDESAPYLNDFLARMQRKWPDRNCRFYHMNSSTDARHLQRLGLPMLITGVDARGAHTPSEHVIWSSMDEHADLIRSYLVDTYAAPTKPRTKVALIAEACATNRLVIGCQIVSKAVAAAGFVPLVLPNVLDDTTLDATLARADALVIFGSIRGEVDARYQYERMLVRKAAARNLPILGICNGLQQINIALGGTIGTNRTTTGTALLDHRWKGSTWTNDQFHAVEVRPDSLVGRTLGGGRQRVNTSHMYSIQKLAPDFEVTAIGPDGVIEAIEHRTKPIVGVQFHPERMAVRDGDKRARKLIAEALNGRRQGDLHDECDDHDGSHVKQ